jgi:hypothetical protein
MELKEIGDVVAVRRLHLEGEEPNTTQILVELGRPAKFPEFSDFYCPYRISGAGEEKLFYAGGVDGIQAIQLALCMIGAYLYESVNPRFGNRLRWEGDEAGDLGFPRS